MFEFISNNLIWQESLIIPILCFVVAVVGWFYFRILFWIALAVFLFCFYFFRNPERICQEALENENVLVCPADGTVVAIEYNEENALEGYAQKVSIFLSPLNVHVNWIPMSGIVSRVAYKPGSFLPAFLPKSSELNERNDVVITDNKNRSIMLRQIAGTVARRIVCWVQQGQTVAVGQKYGMIKFSSRVDIFLPKQVTLEIIAGQRVYGGQTVLGRWK